MNILIVYATYSGSTQAASQIVHDVLIAHPNQVIMKEVMEAQPTDFEQADLIILASPSWDYHGEEGMPHEHYLQAFQTFTGQTYPSKKFAVVGLGDSNFTKFCGSAAHLEHWISELQGQLITDSLRIDQYYFNEDENSQKVRLWAENLASSLA